MAAIIIMVMGLLVWAAVTDIKLQKIPNWIPLAIFGLFLVYLGAQWGFGAGRVLVPPVPALVTGFATLAVFTGLFYFGLIGGGDVKLIAAMGFWAGPAMIVPFLVIMAITGGVVAAFYVFKGGKTRDQDFEVDPEEIFVKNKEKKETKEVINGKNVNKSGKIPYGIAISVGGLFVVNKILTNLIA